MKTRPFNLSLRAQDAENYEITIRGIIGQYIDTETWTVKDTEEDVLNELKKIPAGKKINVHINSRGGDVGLGLGIYNALLTRTNDVTTYNDGYAMSAAAIAMLAGARRISPPASIWMIHRAQGGADGTCKDMRSMSEGLEVIDNMMAKVLAEVSGKKTTAEFLDLMDKTTWLDGQGAVDLGLATECQGEIDPAADDITDSERRIIAQYEKTIPDNLRARITALAPADKKATNQKQPTKAQTMKKLTAALVAAGFTVAIDAEEDAILPHLNALLTERANLKAENQKHIEARKTRVTALVESAITDKIVAETRKAGLIALGETNEAEVIAQIGDLRAAHTAHRPRGVQPAKRGEAESEDAETEIAALHEKLADKTISADERGSFAMQSLEKRGLTGLFKKQTAVKN